MTAQLIHHLLTSFISVNGLSITGISPGFMTMHLKISSKPVAKLILLGKVLYTRLVQVNPAEFTQALIICRMTSITTWEVLTLVHRRRLLLKPTSIISFSCTHLLP